MTKDTQENTQEKIPLDAKLLSEAVIELNISRRSVGLYPSDHPIVKESIDRAFAKLQKMFEIRSSITLGIAGDTLVVDEYKLDRKNPVFSEFANIFHSKGIAAVTFSSGLSIEELQRLHELITDKEMPAGKDLTDKARGKNIVHIVLVPLDFASFNFVEGAQRSGAEEVDIWGDYLYGLVTGTLSSEGEAQRTLLSIPPEEVARGVDRAMPGNETSEAYDRVIASYLSHKRGPKLGSAAYGKFISFVDNLSPELKRQFLTRSFVHVPVDGGEAEKMLSDMTFEDFSRMARVFEENSLVIPETMKNLINKLSALKKGSFGSFDFLSSGNAIIDDVELGEDLAKLFREDNFKSFVSDSYQRDLAQMLESSPDRCVIKSRELSDECGAGLIDRTMMGVMLELTESDCTAEDDYMGLLTKLSEYATMFIETGRFTEVLEIYNTLVVHSLQGRFLHGSSGMREYFFHSEEFIAKFMEALRIWGRKNREDAFMLVRALKGGIIPPLIEALLTEPDASMRKFYLSALRSVGSDVGPYAAKKLDDKRWYVIRNMLYLLRESQNRTYLPSIRKFVKHRNVAVCIEAVKSLLYFNTLDAVPFLKLYLQSENADLRRASVKLAGAFRVKASVPYLVSILEKKDRLGNESGCKIDAVRALGEIADASVMKTLLKVYTATSFFYRGYLEELKVELFRTLDRYPPEASQELLALGLKSRNDEIKEISERVLTRRTVPGETEGRHSV